LVKGWLFFFLVKGLGFFSAGGGCYTNGSLQAVWRLFFRFGRQAGCRFSFGNEKYDHADSKYVNVFQLQGFTEYKTFVEIQ